MPIYNYISVGQPKVYIYKNGVFATGFTPTYTRCAIDTTPGYITTTGSSSTAQTSVLIANSVNLSAKNVYVKFMVTVWGNKSSDQFAMYTDSATTTIQTCLSYGTLSRDYILGTAGGNGTSINIGGAYGGTIRSTGGNFAFSIKEIWYE